eukprot:1241503-Pyramimonas_sp.AAC.1
MICGGNGLLISPPPATSAHPDVAFVPGDANRRSNVGNTYKDHGRMYLDGYEMPGLSFRQLRKVRTLHNMPIRRDPGLSSIGTIFKKKWRCDSCSSEPEN